MTCCTSGRRAGESILPAIWSCHNLTWSPPRLVMRLSDSTTVRKTLHLHSDFSLSSCLPAFRLISINLKRQSQGWLYLIFIQACLMCLTDWEVRNISQGFSFADFPFFMHTYWTERTEPTWIMFCLRVWSCYSLTRRPFNLAGELPSQEAHGRLCYSGKSNNTPQTPDS